MAIPSVSSRPPPSPSSPKKEPAEKPAPKEAKPGTDSAKPGTDSAKPGTDSAKRTTDAAEPTAGTAKPATDSLTSAAADKTAQTDKAAASKPEDTFSVEASGNRRQVSLGADVGGTDRTSVVSKIESPPDIGNVGMQSPKVLAAAGVGTQGISGEERAKQDVNVQTVADDRAKVSETQQALRNETTQKANDIISGTGELPPRATVNKLSDNEAEMVRVDESGNVLERTRATRGADGSVSLDSKGYENGVNTHTTTEALADGGSRVRNAQWEGSQSEIDSQTSFDDLEKSRDPKYTYSDNRVGEKDADGNWVSAGQGKLSVDEYAQSEGTVKGSQTTYATQRSGDGLDDKLQGPFNFDQDVDRATTHSYSIAAPDGSGQQAPPEYQRIERFSQGEVQATSIVNSELHDDAIDHSAVDASLPPPDNYKNYINEAGEGNHTREDLNRVRDAHTDFWGGKYDADGASENGNPPKRWLVEMKKDENTYASQTFMEGAPNASISTERKLNGNTVTENYAGKTFSPDGKELVDVSGQSTSTYGADGKLDKLDTSRKDRDGTSQEHHYARTTENTPDGARQTEKTDSKFWDKDNKETSAKQERVSLQTPQGERELSLRNEVTGAAGTAIHEVNEGGDRLTFKNAEGEARDITDPSQFQSGEEENLALNAVTTSKAMAEGGVVVSSLSGKMGGAEGALGAAKISDSLNNAKNSTKVFEGLVGAAGIAGASLSLHDAIKDKDRAAQGLASLQLVGSTMEFTAAASAANKALSGLSAFERLGTAGAVLGGAAAIWEGTQNINKGLEAGLNGQVAQGAVDIVGGAGAIGAALLGAPVIGAAIGVGGFAIKGIIDLVNDDEHKIGELTIDDEGSTPPQEPPPADPQALTPEEESYLASIGIWT